MPEIIHFRGSDKIIKKKHLENDIKATMEYVQDVLFGTLYRGELFRQALDEMGWRENGTLNILEGRRYTYKGFKKGIAIEGSFAAYEFILEGMLRLQLGFDKGKIDAGVLFLTSQRSEKSSYGTSAELAKVEMEMLYPTINVPVMVALFDLGKPAVPEEEGGEKNGLPVPADEEWSEKDLKPEPEENLQPEKEF
jgi:hypothetical protein